MTASLEGVQLALRDAARDVSQTLAEIEAFEILTTADAEFLRDIADKALKYRNQFEEQRKEATSPLLKSKATIDSWFKPITEGYGQIRTRINQRLTEAKRKAEAAQEAALAEVAARGGHVDETTIVPAHHSAQVTLPKGVGRTVVVVKVVNPDLVPRSWCCPDESLLKHEATAAHKRGHLLQVPGVEIEYKESGT